MAEVAGIGGADFPVARGANPPEENARLNRPVREDARPEDNNASPVRSNAAQAEQTNPQPSQTTNDGDARQNAANTGGFTTGGTDRGEDTVFISPEARNAARATADTATTATAFATTAGEPQVTAPAEEPRGVGNDRGTTPRAAEPEGLRPAQTDASAPQPAVAAANAPEASEPAAAEQTNQRVRNENTNAEVNGSEAEQSEQSRTIGQVIDVFA